MTTGEKLTNLRKQNNYTQENLSDILGVSRQAISKWESDNAYPETDKIIKLAELYNCSVDYLLKDELNECSDTLKDKKENSITFSFNNIGLTYQSKKRFFNMPLVDVNFKLTGVAKGFIAIGFRAKGIISLGVLSMGIISLGLLSLGLISLGCFALGLLALGAISLGIFALGAVAIGIFALGAVAIGLSSCGALGIGYYYAYGDYAYSNNIAVFNTKGEAPNLYSIYDNKDLINDAITKDVPAFFRWFCRLFK